MTGADPFNAGSVKRVGLVGRPRLLDLFCGAGGAARGYAQAGFDVYGVDIKPQPRYPYWFLRSDALEFMDSGAWRGFDAIHASPPCQKFTRFQQSQPKRVNPHPDLIAPTRERLLEIGLPWVIENVPGAPLIEPIQMCGTSFGLGVARGQLWRHRIFESSMSLQGAGCFHDGQPAVMVAGHGRDGYRGSGLAAAEARQAMGIDWMNRDELKEAIPPSYTYFIGNQLLSAMAVAA
jgi:DNA (cytosine-5)-methyltransferase 1